MRRYLYIALIVIFTALVILFKFQNLETATVSLFSMSVTLPVSLLVFAIYVLGMFTGGFMLSLLRSWARGAVRRP
jgi:lipopolysaccharide assembly protein A